MATVMRGFGFPLGDDRQCRYRTGRPRVTCTAGCSRRWCFGIAVAAIGCRAGLGHRPRPARRRLSATAAVVGGIVADHRAGWRVRPDLLSAEPVSGDPIIRVDRRRRSASARAAIFRDVSFTVASGRDIRDPRRVGLRQVNLMRQLIGLLPPSAGRIEIFGAPSRAPQGDVALREVQRRMGVMFQSGALFGSMTLLENVMLPLEMFTDLPPEGREAVARVKLGLVGLATPPC